MLLSRDEIVTREEQILAPYALRSGQTKGREYPHRDNDFRTPFQRDRDRILHTTAFRRLEYKTQVFVNHEGDYFRTRLTHTLEVAQIGRTIARALAANEDLVEAICLAHDLGHPPFGHSGEYALDEIMKPFGGFEHNQQSLRIVTELEQRYSDFPGLNLTYEVREGIVKHETSYDRSQLLLQYSPEANASLEAQIANAADELAYTAHDLDDGLYAGLLTPYELEGLELWEAGKEYLRFSALSFDELARHRLTSWLIGYLVVDMCEATHLRIVQAGVSSPEALQALQYSIAGHSEERARMVRQLKDYLFENMYRHYRVVRMSQKASFFIRELFHAYRKELGQLPPPIQQRLSAGKDSPERVICDYISGMTDRYALQEYQKLFDPFTRP